MQGSAILNANDFLIVLAGCILVTCLVPISEGVKQLGLLDLLATFT